MTPWRNAIDLTQIYPLKKESIQRPQIKSSTLRRWEPPF